MHAPERVKETVLNSMTDEHGHLRVLICTIAFGMGVDVKAVRTIVNFEPSRNFESYVQESGHCSRDGRPGECVILYLGKMLTTSSDDIKSYILSEKCHRSHINSFFDEPTTTRHNCWTTVLHLAFAVGMFAVMLLCAQCSISLQLQPGGSLFVPKFHFGVWKLPCRTSSWQWWSHCII